VHAERRRGSAWLLGLRRMKAGGAGGQGEKGGVWLVGRGVGRWAGWLGPAGRPRLEEWAGQLGWKRKEKGNPLEIDF
jgi:hypothetical protein